MVSRRISPGSLGAANKSSASAFALSAASTCSAKAVAAARSPRLIAATARSSSSSTDATPISWLRVTRECNYRHRYSRNASPVALSRRKLLGGDHESVDDRLDVRRLRGGLFCQAGDG